MLKNHELPEVKLHVDLMKLKMVTVPDESTPEHFIINSSLIFTISQHIVDIEQRCYSSRIRDEEHPKGCCAQDLGTVAVNDIYKHMKPLPNQEDNTMISIHQDYLQALYDACDSILSHRMKAYPYTLPKSL